MTYDEFANALAAYDQALDLVGGIGDHPDYFYIFENIEKAHRSLGNLEKADFYKSKFIHEEDLYTQETIEINVAAQQFNQLVFNYYEELEVQREAKQTKTMLFAIIIGLSTLLFLFVSYHFASRYFIRRALSEELDKLIWID